MCAHTVRRIAYATVLFGNDSYVPGALVLAHSLREQETRANLVAVVTSEVSSIAIRSLQRHFDRVVVVPPLVVQETADQRRQYLSRVLTRLHALRLGPDGDLGAEYEKLVLLDADVLPLRCFDHLFLVDAPAGILNEKAEYFRRSDGDRLAGVRTAPSHGRWHWHHQYRKWPHGANIPERITDRVLADSSNYGVNTAVLVLEPSMSEFDLMRRSIECLDGPASYLPEFRWPDMQFLTAWYSGRWHNVDLCFAGLGGYPSIDVLFGTHFAGPKPWQVRHRSVAERFSRFPDFHCWYSEYLQLVESDPLLLRWKKLRRIHHFAEQIVFGVTNKRSYA